MSDIMSIRMHGRVWKFGDNVLNDGHITSLEALKAGNYEASTLAPYCMTGLDPDFPKKASAGDLIVAGKNFGKGQNHITGPLAIKGMGIGVITRSMTRPFFRQSVVAGLMMLPFVDEIITFVDQGDVLDVDFRTGRIVNETKQREMQAEPLPDLMLEFLLAGGEREWLANQLAAGA
jgi:3-isopropylmalate/(R)-2-methylmalate dehydratase small subunit